MSKSPVAVADLRGQRPRPREAGSLVFVLSFKAVGIQPRDPLLGRAMVRESNLRPQWAPEANVDMPAMIVPFNLAAEFLQSLRHLFDIRRLRGVTVQSLPFRQTEFDEFSTAARSGDRSPCRRTIWLTSGKNG